MKRVGFFVLPLLAVSLAVAVARRPVRAGGLAPDAPAPAVYEPLPFHHGTHDATFVAKGISCVTCHPVGARTATGAPDRPLPTPLATCHGCHLGEVKRSPRKATAWCTQCHPHRAELLPADHRVGWMQAHAIEARALSNGCATCHEDRMCIDCHEARGALATTPHPPGFRATHGIEARVDPASCSTCHVESSCTACHASGVIPW